MLDYPCAKFGDFTFSRFGFIMQTNRQTDRQTHRITDAAKRLSHGVSKDLVYDGFGMRYELLCCVRKYDAVAGIEYQPPEHISQYTCTYNQVAGPLPACRPHRH